LITIAKFGCPIYTHRQSQLSLGLLVIYYVFANKGGGGIKFFGRPAVRQSLSVSCLAVDIYFTWRVLSPLCERISMKLATNIHHCIAEKTVNVRGQGQGHLNNRLRTVPL